MAYDKASEETQTSAFNAAVFQMGRLHKLQDTINSCNSNRLAFNDSYGIYNYELIFRCLSSLYKETRPKLVEADKELGDRFEKVIGEYIDNGITLNVKDFSDKPKLNPTKWKSLSKCLSAFENLVRDFLDKTRMNSPTAEDEGMW